MSWNRTRPLAGALLVWLTASPAARAVDAAPHDLLSLLLEKQESRLSARVFLDTVVAGIQGFSFAVCHQTADGLLEEAVPGVGIIQAGGPAGASFISIRLGGASGEGHAIIAAVLDFDGESVFDIGSHEVLDLRYTLAPGGDGGSLRFCEAGDPPVEILLIREGKGTTPLTQRLDPGIENHLTAGTLQGTRGDGLLPNSVPVVLSTNRPGLTGFTVVLCHEPGIVSVGDVAATPEVMPFVPSFIIGSEEEEFPSLEHTRLVPSPSDCATCTKEGFRVSVQFAAPLPRVENLPVLRIFYSVQGRVGQVSPLSFCRVSADAVCADAAGGGRGGVTDLDGLSWGGLDLSGFPFDFFLPEDFADPIVEVCNSIDTLTVLRFAEERIYPGVTPGSIRVSFEPRHTFMIPHLSVPAADPIRVDVNLHQSDLIEFETRSIDLVAAFDRALFQVIEESGVEVHRGGALSAWLAAEPGPVTDSRRYEDGFFSYHVDFGPCAVDTAFFPQPISFGRFRLTRKRLPLPGGGEGLVAGGPFPIRFEPLVIDGNTEATNQFRAHRTQSPPCSSSSQVRTPALRDGSLTISDSGISFEPSSAEVEYYQAAEITISLNSAKPGITALTYTVTHDPSVLAIRNLQDSPEVAALGPVSSTFDRNEDGFTHTVVLDAQRPLGVLDSLPLARVTYLPVARGGRSSPIGVVASGDRRPVVVIPIGGEPAAYVPAANRSGEVRLKEDPTLLALKVPTLRAPPGAKVQVPLYLDATSAGVPALHGALCHDRSRAAPDPSSLGGSVVNLGAALSAIPGVVHSIVQLNDDGGLSFSAGSLQGALPMGRDLELFKIAYDLTGRYGDEVLFEFCRENSVEALNLTTGEFDRPMAIANLVPGKVLLTEALAMAIPPAGSVTDQAPGGGQAAPSLAAVAMTEFGWHWGIERGSRLVRHYHPRGDTFGPEIEVSAEPLRIANGGEGWAWVSLPDRLAILRFDGVDREVPVDGEPFGIVVDRERNAWVAVGGTGTVLKVSRDGRILRQVALGIQLSEPRDLAIDEEGGIWVTQQDGDAVSRLAPDGALVRRSAARLRSRRPAGIAADGRGRVWVSDAGDRSILAFDLEGREVGRLSLDGEPTAISLDGKGALWTMLRRDEGGTLVRLLDSAQGLEVTTFGPSSVEFGDRTGLDSLRLLLPLEDSDQDGIGNLIEIKNRTDPLDETDPPLARSIPPVQRLSAAIVGVRLAAAGIKNKVGVSWTNSLVYTRHLIALEGVVLPGEVPGDSSSTVIEDVPPGPLEVSVQSFLGDRSSPVVSTRIQMGPGGTLRSVEVAGIQATDLALDPETGNQFVLNGLQNQVVMLDKDFQEIRRFQVAPPLGDRSVVLTGLAFRVPGPGGGGIAEGSLVVLDGFGGRYQSISLTGDLLEGPFRIPFGNGQVFFFDHLGFGFHESRPTLFTVARGPTNDCIIFFRFGEDRLATELPSPLSGAPGTRFTLGGLSFLQDGDAARLWIATGLVGDVIPRLVLGIPLTEGPPVNKVFLDIFESPEGTAQLRGLAFLPRNGTSLALTSDRRIHLLSDFGVSKDTENSPQIQDVSPDAGGGEFPPVPGAIGPLAGGTRVVLEGVNLGPDPTDLRVLFGETPAQIVSLTGAGGVDRLTVLSPPAAVEGPVPIFVFRTRGLDFLEASFVYCEPPVGPFTDCNGDGVADSCQLPLNDCDGDGLLDVCALERRDCNGNGIPDSCDVASGRSSDSDEDGLPDECRTFLRQDPNFDGTSDLSDPIYLLGFLFLGKPVTLSCERSGDCNDDGTLDLADPVCLLTHLFIDPRPLAEPFQACGRDPTPDGLGCDSFPPCSP